MTTNTEQRIDIAGSIAQLRHAYKHLVDGTTNDLPRFAKGLITPAVEYLEGLSAALAPKEADRG